MVENLYRAIYVTPSIEPLWNGGTLCTRDRVQYISKKLRGDVSGK